MVSHPPLPQPTKPTASAWAVLAGLRWCLAGIVMLLHLEHTFVPSSPWLDFIVSFGGKAAVMGFFLISGYSIAHSYGERPDGYFRRRFLRIYPLYCVAVLFTQFVVFITPSPAVCLNGYAYVSAGFLTSVANLLLLQQFIAIPLTYDIPLWTLSIEVFYYLLAPLLYRMPPFALALFIVASMIAFQFPLANPPLYGYVALVFFWPWLIGFLLGQSRGGPVLPVVLGLLGGVLVFISVKETPEPLSVVTYLVTLGAILTATRFNLPSFAQKAANLLGDWSYPLYLFHVPLMIFFFKHFGVRSFPAFLVCVIGSTVLLWYIFDEKLKRWFWIPLVDAIIRLLRALSRKRGFTGS